MSIVHRHNTRHRRLRPAVPALALVASLGLAACSASPSSSTTAPGESRAPRSTVTTVAETPVSAAGLPVTVRIPAIDVDAEIIEVGLQADGAMEVPDFGLAGWYGPGPRPGEPGPAVVVAHVDSRAGPDVFHRLRDLQAGDRVEVLDDEGVAHHFEVTHLEQVPKDALPVERIWDATTEPVLRLITCGGSFDRSTRHYRDNVIAYAIPLA